MSPLSFKKSPVGKQIPHLFYHNCPFIGRFSEFLYVYHLYSWFVDSIRSSNGLVGAGGTISGATLSSVEGTGCDNTPSCAGIIVEICLVTRWWAIQPLDWRRWDSLISSYVVVGVLIKGKYFPCMDNLLIYVMILPCSLQKPHTRNQTLFNV